jgi:hypothetical protein
MMTAIDGEPLNFVDMGSGRVIFQKRKQLL